MKTQTKSVVRAAVDTLSEWLRDDQWAPELVRSIVREYRDELDNELNAAPNGLVHGEDATAEHGSNGDGQVFPAGIVTIDDNAGVPAVAEKPKKRVHGKKKRCTKCQHLLVLSNFSKHTRNPDGLQYHCKKCVSAYNRERRESC